MKASAKIKPSKTVYVSRRRGCMEETETKRIVNVGGRSQDIGPPSSPYVSLPREPWADEVTE